VHARTSAAPWTSCATGRVHTDRDQRYAMTSPKALIAILTQHRKTFGFRRVSLWTQAGEESSATPRLEYSSYSARKRPRNLGSSYRTTKRVASNGSDGGVHQQRHRQEQPCRSNKDQQRNGRRVSTCQSRLGSYGTAVRSSFVRQSLRRK
jgi:hypothetical protein